MDYISYDQARNMSIFSIHSSVFCRNFNVIVVVATVLQTALFAAQSNPPTEVVVRTGPVIIGPPPLTIDPPALDFGFIAPGEPKTGIFTLKNPTNTPFTIVALQPTCTCTSITDLSGRVIAPGESIQFDASLAASISRSRPTTLETAASPPGNASGPACRKTSSSTTSHSPRRKTT